MSVHHVEFARRAVGFAALMMKPNTTDEDVKRFASQLSADEREELVTITLPMVVTVLHEIGVPRAKIIAMVWDFTSAGRDVLVH